MIRDLCELDFFFNNLLNIFFSAFIQLKCVSGMIHVLLLKHGKQEATQLVLCSPDYRKPQPSFFSIIFCVENPLFFTKLT